MVEYSSLELVKEKNGKKEGVNVKVSEVFPSLQGEGPRAGRQTIFVRLSGCNMKPLCVWCDTKYAEEGYKLSIPEIRDKVIKAGIARTKDITFTGGEPLIQTDAIMELMGEFPSTYHINIETNGTIYRKLQRNPTVIISPKLSNAKVNLHYDKRWATDIALSDIWFKFVVSNEVDVMEAMDFADENTILHNRIFIMPQCTTQLEHMELWPRVFEWALKYNVHASPRLQTLAFGNKRGI